MRNVGAVLVGLFVGSVLNMAILFANMALFPLPAGTDFNDPVQMAAAIQAMPTAAFFGVFLAHHAQAFVGGLIAARLGAGNPRALAATVAVMTLAGSVFNAVQLAAPLWTWIEMPLYLVTGWASGEIEVRRRRGLPDA